jgi:hypothetical protein
MQFKNPSIIAQRIALGMESLDNLGSSLQVTPIADSNGTTTSYSVAVTVFNEKQVPKTDSKHSSTVKEDTLFSADSMTKMLTAAAILRMSELDKYSNYLSKGVDTALSDLLPILKRRYSGSTYIRSELEKEPNFQEITIAHLAQHISGLAKVSRKALDKALEKNGKLIPEEIIDVKKVSRTNKFGENIGEFSYNDLGYELLGRILIALASEQKQSAVSFNEVVNELVIDRVRKKLPVTQQSSLKFFTSDQMEIFEGKTRVINHPELEVEFGPNYEAGNLKYISSHSYDLSCGGSYTDSESMSEIAFYVLHSSPNFSIYQKSKTLEILNSRWVLKRDSDGSLNKQNKTYGFGYESFDHSDYNYYRDHGGLGYGSNSNAFIDTKNNNAVVVMISFENLALPLAYALVYNEKSNVTIKLTEELFNKSKELYSRYNEKDLVIMRNCLDSSYESFKEIYKKITRS